MLAEYRCKYTKMLGMSVKNTNKISNKCLFVGIFIGKMYFFHSKICFENEKNLPLRR